MRLYPYGPKLFLLLLLLIGVSNPLVTTRQAGAAEVAATYIRRVRKLETARLGIANPAGLAFAPKVNLFQVIQRRQGASAPATTDLFQLPPIASVINTVQLAAQVDDPINLTFDERWNRLLIYRTAPQQLLAVLTDANGALDPKRLHHYKGAAFGLQNPQGMSVDPVSGDLYFLDAAGPRLVRVTPDETGSFDNAVVVAIDLAAAAIVNPRGLAWNPHNEQLYLLSPTSQTLYELTPAGQVLTTRDLAAFALQNPQAMLFAPSGDMTDDPAAVSLYVADAGRPDATQSAELPNNAAPCATLDLCANRFYLPLAVAASADDTVTTADEMQAATVSPDDGAIVELSLVEPTAAAAATFTSSLVRTVNMAALSPPSPDPSGITYQSAHNRLVVVDGEVEETVGGVTHFQGANVWELTLGGSVVRTANINDVAPSVVRITDEPTGITWHPGNGHYYITDDDARRVYDLNPGGDGLIGTTDDTWSSFDTLAAGSSDPEGIAFDPINNRLFVADGLNREIYQFTVNGSLVSHFDVAQYGVLDPESVEFNPTNGALLVLSNDTSRVIVETTTNGALLQTLDVAAANAIAPAGLAYAPASDGSGAKRFYIVARGIDNNENPNIIDGKLYELTAPQPTGNAAPIVNAGPDQSRLPGTITLDGTVSDDGQPTPPTLTTTWSQVSGPDTVAFGDANAVDTTVTFTTIGPYVLRLTADDGALTANDEVNITVSEDAIFADDFETGNLAAWSASVNTGSLSVTPVAALAGSAQGLRLAITSNSDTYLTDLTPASEPRYRARFYFDPNSIVMGKNNAHYLFYGISGTTIVGLRVELRFSSGSYQLRAGLVNDGGNFLSTSWVIISDAPHSIELDWRKSSAPGANSGGLTLWIDNVQRADLNGVDNDTRPIDSIRLGAVAGIDSSTRGAYYFDAFVARRQSFIGP